MTDRTKTRWSSAAGLPAVAKLGGRVKGRALYRARQGDMLVLRKKPGPVPEGWGRIPPSLLRYADEQTIVATAAVFSAIQAMGSHPDQFKDWGVVVASRYLGRANLAVALRSFAADGVWGTSPHLIPHFALHSASGTISLALGSHGPNLGAGGGLHTVSEGFLAALTWLSTGVVPGVWLVTSGWSPELVPDPRGDAPVAGECLALALALAGIDDEADGPVFRAIFGSDAPPDGDLPSDPAWLAEILDGDGVSLPRTIATDATGWMLIELIDGSDLAG